MNATEIVEQAITKLEADDANNSADDQKDTSKTDDTSKETHTEDDKAGKSAATDDDSKADDAKSIDKEEVDDKDKADGEFTADDAVEVEEKQPEQPQAPTDNAGIQLSPAEQKFIADNIGEPIVLRGIRGEGDNAKPVEIKAYSPADIPADFKFANDRELASAQTGFYALEQKANQLLGSYRNSQSEASAKEFEQRENEGIRADIADLQKEGRFPKFKVRPGEAGFDNDPAAKTITEVLQVMADRNDMYLKQYQQGRPYKHIGFAEAYDLWEKNNPQKQAEKVADTKQKKEDDERGKVADRVGNNQTLTQEKLVKPTVKSGTSLDQILARHEMEDW